MTNGYGVILGAVGRVCGRRWSAGVLLWGRTDGVDVRVRVKARAVPGLPRRPKAWCAQVPVGTDFRVASRRSRRRSSIDGLPQNQ